MAEISLLQMSGRHILTDHKIHVPLIGNDQHRLIHAQNLRLVKTAAHKPGNLVGFQKPGPRLQPLQLHEKTGAHHKCVTAVDAFFRKVNDPGGDILKSAFAGAPVLLFGSICTRHG